MRSTTRSLAQWNGILAHLQHSKLSIKQKSLALLLAETECSWAYRIAPLEDIWIKCALCSYCGKLLILIYNNSRSFQFIYNAANSPLKYSCPLIRAFAQCKILIQGTLVLTAWKCLREKNKDSQSNRTRTNTSWKLLQSVNASYLHVFRSFVVVAEFILLSPSTSVSPDCCFIMHPPQSGSPHERDPKQEQDVHSGRILLFVLLLVASSTSSFLLYSVAIGNP